MNKLRFFWAGVAVIVALFATPLRGQTPEGGAVWSTQVTAADGSTGEYDVVFEVRITPRWHIYDLGPYPIPSMATAFDFSTSEGLKLVGGVRQMDEPRRQWDDVFGFEVAYFEDVARFAQRVRPVAGGSQALLGGEVEYQVCSDEGCVRGVWEFSVPVSAEASIVTAAPAENAMPVGESKSLWGMILEAVLWGLAALMTPCVFPMVPMTVSFFMKDGGGRVARMRALMFGIFIVSLYTLPIAALIVATRLIGGEVVTADIFNWLATHWIPNVLFFIVFMLFAASLLGAFEIRMPSRLVNRSDRGAEKKGLAGIFFLALTLVLVSFSCTGPIVGAVLIKSTQGEAWTPIVTMLAFSVAFALPFTLLAFFPRLMEKLPHSGGWLNSVKVILAMIEIALGLKFLSVADQTYHWGILPRELYLAIWIVVAVMLGLYLLGKLRFKYDSPVDHIGVGRFAGAIIAFTFAVWLVPGMWGAPLKALSGYLPPMESQSFVLGAGASQPVGAQTAHEVKYSDKLSLPHGLAGYFDLEQGLAHAREVGKPVFLDFTGHGCVNCREMEQRVWVDGEVLGLLRERFVIVALYSDDRTRLPESEWLTTAAGKELKTLGRKNSYIAGTRYGISAQPAYLILDAQGRSLLPAYGYSLSIPAFVDFLKRGLDTYNNTQNYGKSQ